MPVVRDDDGVVRVESSPATTGLAGRMFKRREPQPDDPAGEVLTVLGAMDVGGSAGPVVELVAASATYGAIPDGWESATVTFDLSAFAESYREITGAERAALALEQLAEAKAATEAQEPRESPWRRA